MKRLFKRIELPKGQIYYEFGMCLTTFEGRTAFGFDLGDGDCYVDDKHTLAVTVEREDGKMFLAIYIEEVEP